MDYNSKIKWEGGIELTSQLFQQMDEYMDIRQFASIHLAAGTGSLGLVPLTKFVCKPAFVGQSIEIVGLNVVAILPSAQVICAQEDVVFDVVMPEPGPYKDGTYYYLTVGLSGERIEFERDEVPYSRPKYEFGIHKAEQIRPNSLMPVGRFKIVDGSLNIDTDFIPPVLEINLDGRIDDFRNRIVEKLEQATGSKANYSSAASIIQSHTFKLKEVKKNDSLQNLVNRIDETVRIVNYLMKVTDEESAQEFKVIAEPGFEPDIVDIEPYFRKVLSFLDVALTLTDRLDEKRPEIDLSALKEEVKKELHEQLHPEIMEHIEGLKNEIREQLNEELEVKIPKALDSMKAVLHDELNIQLKEELYQPLYDALYKALYDALFVPAKEEEDNFIPLI